MNINLSHKIELNPNNKQSNFLARACGVSRFTYNWGLAEWKKQYESGLKPTGFGLKKEFNAVKKDLFPWIMESPRDANSQSFADLQTAFNNFFKGRSGYPVFKKKGCNDSFYIANDQFKIDCKKIRIPKIGWIRLKESLNLSGKILSASVSRSADKWFVSISLSMEITPVKIENQDIIGVDLGIKHLAAVSNGEKIEGSRALKRMEKKLKRLQQSFSKTQKGSKNREKQKRKISRLHYRIRCIRLDLINKLTTKLSKNHSVIVIEDLNVKGMMANHKLAKAISDMGFYEFKRQMEYKSKIFGSHIIIADRWFPSSKRCSICGNINKDLTLSDRIFKCPSCSSTIDRDLNAAINLSQYQQLMAA
ncbi:MAG: transposase [Desulfamplus sp.]|nr:transposase [Desulfamplus sp.]